MELPNLYGIVKEADVRTKGQGNYKASYVPWAKVSALLLQHAPGFHFELKKILKASLGLKPQMVLPTSLVISRLLMTPPLLKWFTASWIM